VSGAASLVRLQELDSQIVHLESEISALQSALRSDPELEKRRSRAREAEADRETAAAQLAAAEQELAAIETKGKSLDRRLFDGSVRNPNDLLEMQRELAVLRSQVSTSEDQIIGLLDAGESASRSAEEALASVEALELRRAADEGPRRERLADMQASLAEVRQDRATLVGSLAASDLALYARVAAKHQPAVVSIKGDACGGCHLPLSNEERRAVRAGDRIVQCSNCDRILVP